MQIQIIIKSINTSSLVPAFFPYSSQIYAED